MSNNLSKSERRKVERWRTLSYDEKESIRLTEYEQYKMMISLLEIDEESRVVISHKKYREANDTYNRGVVNSINPKIFLTIKYQPVVSSSYDRTVKAFLHIKNFLLSYRPEYKFIHYVEKGIDHTCHSHIFISGYKGKNVKNQMEWLNTKLEEYTDSIAAAISNANNAIDIRRFDDKSLNLSPDKRTNYVNKQTSRQYLSIDIFNSDLPKSI
jgi:hypothetical protein